MRRLALLLAAAVVCAATPANGAPCWGLDPDRLPEGAAATPPDMAKCTHYIGTMQFISASTAGDLGARAAELGRLQKAYFEGFCRTHPQAAAYRERALVYQRTADAYVPKPWELEMRAAHAADATADRSASAAHESAALRLLPADAAPADVANAYRQIGCLRMNRNDAEGALGAYRDGLARIGDAPLLDRTHQVAMLFGASTLLASMGRDADALNYGQRAGEAYLASQVRIVTQGTPLSQWLVLLAVRQPEPFLTLQRQVGDAMMQSTGVYVDRSVPAAPQPVEQADAEYDRTVVALGNRQRDTSDRNMSGALQDIAAAEQQVAQAPPAERAAAQARLLQRRIALAELQMWDATFWSQMGDHPRALDSATKAMRAWSQLRLPESGSTFGARTIKYQLTPAGDVPARYDAYASMIAAFESLASGGLISTASQIGRGDALNLVDAAWSLSH